MRDLLTRRVRLLLPAVAIVALFAAVACGGDDDDEPTPAAEATTPAAQATTAASPSATTPAAAYPVKVTDLLGREVEIKAKPETIVALSPTATELVYAAGGEVAGRTSSVDYPEAAKAATDVGTAYQPNFEAILALKPDLIVADSVIHAQPNLRQPIEQLPVPVIFAGADSYQHVLDGLTLMGEVLDAQATTETVIADITKARDEAKAAIAGKQVSAVALIADRDNTLYAAKDASFAGDILKQLGISNPAAPQPDSGPFPGYTTLAAEKLVEFNPDFIFAITPAPPPAPRLAELIPTIPPFRGLKAVTQNHVVDADVQIFLQAPGPRIAEAFKVVAGAVMGSAN
ncbi:MAG TPA: ABC transporter substrate-binding protein [Tepidiformaceae bacterium]|nr:ABC transporter substrate-binding protein [Tepidiformaceae bacterium]